MYQGAMSGVSLRLENISKEVGRGAGRKKILNQVYGDIGSNEFVAIIGGSGAGKTTVMNAMSGFDRDIEGNVFCNGIDLRRNFNSLKHDWLCSAAGYYLRKSETEKDAVIYSKNENAIRHNKGRNGTADL